MSATAVAPRYTQAQEDDARRLLTAPETYATVLLVLAVDRLGPELLADPELDEEAWAPATLREELRGAFGVTIEPGNLDRLATAILLVRTGDFYADLDFFVRACNVLSGSAADFGTFDPATAEECAWGVAEATLLWPVRPEENEPFSDAIVAYVQAALRREGYVRPPAMLAGLVGDPGLTLDEFADDPELYAALVQAGQDKADETDTIVQELMHELIEQLARLPLRHGSARQLVANLRRGLRAA